MIVTFSAGNDGEWAIRSMNTLAGAPLAQAEALHVSVEQAGGGQATWRLAAFTSNLRYTTANEAAMLAATQAGLGRSEAVRAALIPIRKSPRWWSLAQDERREIYQERSRHTTIGAEYLPMIARRLHHCRDLGEPFDFLTWFEFAPEHESAFDHMLSRMRASEEWGYVDREVDIRLDRRR
jgi:hypothetical protein